MPKTDMRSPILRRLLANLFPIVLLCMTATTLWKWPHAEFLMPAAVVIILSTYASVAKFAAFYITAVISISTTALALNNLNFADLQLSPLDHSVIWCLAGFIHWIKSFQNIAYTEISQAFDATGNAILVTDQSGCIVSANATASEFFLESQAQIIGQNLNNLAGDELWTAIVEGQQKSNADEASNLEFVMVRENGDQQTYSCTATHTQGNYGEPAYFIVQILDITAAQTTKHALVNAGRQMRRVFGKSSDFILLTDTKLNITYANDNATNALSHDLGELLERPVYELIHTDFRRAFMKCLEQFSQINRNESSLAKVQLADVDEIPASLHIVRLGAPEQNGYAFIFSVAEQHMKALAQAKLSQVRFSQIFHGVPDAILLIRAVDAVVLDFNEGFTRLLGYRREDAIGECETDLALWAKPTERDAILERVRHERELIDHETIMRTNTGATVHVELSIRYVEIDGELCALCMGRDITKRISAEAALVETEEKFVKVFEGNPDGITILRESDGVVTDANETMLTRGGYTREEVIGHSLYGEQIFVDPEDLALVGKELEQDGKISNQPVTFFTKSGAKMPALISATMVDLSGETHLMIIAKDVSKQRSTEERLRSSEERFRGIFENAPIGIMLVDMEGRIFQANRTAAELLAYDEQHMYGLHISRLVPANERQNLKTSLFSLTVKDKSIDEAERRLVCQNGLEVWTNFHIVLQKNSIGEAQYYIVQIADISDIKKGQDRMERMAFYDTLTDLVNRRLFQERLEQAIERSVRSQKSAALLYLDLDNFKRVNDTLGHQVGDHLLKEVAARLKACVRAEDTVGRTGGDEFNILLSEIGSPTDAGMVAQKILNHLREPIQVSGHPLIVTTSIGITVIPGDSQDPNELMRNADLAMYKAKERGRNNYQFYSNDLNTNAAKRLRTEYEIRQAIDRDEFVLFYQPKVALSNRQIVGVESLIRWHHPERGLLAPDEFIEVAEDTGSIIDIGTWVIEEACRACQQLNDCSSHPIQVAINISPRQFRDPNLVSTMRRSLREASLDPGNIEVEITETMLMQDVEAARMTLQRLADLGVSLAIDDFGTGYSSLNYLKRFPINTVKVDRSFVMDLPTNADDMAITRAVIAMAHQLKMEVVAEGVETNEQLEFLAKQKCEYAQGWLFSKAVPLEDVIDLVKSDLGIIHLG